jgi:hypothetical protein
MINEDAFTKCRSLKRVISEEECQLLECHGFRGYIALVAQVFQSELKIHVKESKEMMSYGFAQAAVLKRGITIRFGLS